MPSVLRKESNWAVKEYICLESPTDTPIGFLDESLQREKKGFTRGESALLFWKREKKERKKRKKRRHVLFSFLLAELRQQALEGCGGRK